MPLTLRKRHPKLFANVGGGGMQRTNPSPGGAEPGVNDDLVYGRSRCTGDEDLYYDQRCFEFDGSGTRAPTQPRSNQFGKCSVFSAAARNDSRLEEFLGKVTAVNVMFSRCRALNSQDLLLSYQAACTGKRELETHSLLVTSQFYARVFRVF